MRRFDNQGSTANFASHSSGGGIGSAQAFKPEEQRNIAQVRDAGLGLQEKPDYFWMRATIVYIKQENLSYPACPTDKCNKKVLMEGEDQWRCEKCDMVHSAPEYRCVLRSPSSVACAMEVETDDVYAATSSPSTSRTRPVHSGSTPSTTSVPSSLGNPPVKWIDSNKKTKPLSPVSSPKSIVAPGNSLFKPRAIPSTTSLGFVTISGRSPPSTLSRLVRNWSRRLHGME